MIVTKMRAITPEAKESIVLGQCLNYLKLKGLCFFRHNNISFIKDGRYTKFSGTYGVSDIITVLPPHGKILCIECKSKKGKQTENQMNFERAVKESGGFYIVVRDVCELIKFLNDQKIENA